MTARPVEQVINVYVVIVSDIFPLYVCVCVVFIVVENVLNRRFPRIVVYRMLMKGRYHFDRLGKLSI